MKALVVVDIQKDFLPGGALAVSNGDEILPLVNHIMTGFEQVVATQDWHPANHESFASNHQHGSVGQVIDLLGLPQILWPDHCVQFTSGSEFADRLDVNLIHKVIRKGMDPKVDSYSGFFDNDRKQDTGLAAYLRSKNVDELFIVGLATDYCVKFTALDAVSLGFKTTVLSDAVKAVNLEPDDHQIAVNDMRIAGVQISTSSELFK